MPRIMSKEEVREMRDRMFPTPEAKLAFSRRVRLVKNRWSHQKVFQANDRFSRACSAVNRALWGLAYGEEDIAAFGAPSECLTQVYRTATREALEGIEEAGYTVATFVHECERRLDDKTIYYGQLYSLFPIDQVIQAEREFEHDQARIADSGC